MGRGQVSKIRIIGGAWRGRRLPVTDAPGLRPSGDRARETLFNWLQPHLDAASCLDAFAGTGALGLEAASRGARSVVCVEQNAAVAGQLRDNVATLGAADIEVVTGDFLRWLTSAPPGHFDSVFLDPPFGENLVQASADRLADSGVLVAGAFVYCESARRQPAVAAPAGWSAWREKTVGEVRLQLFRFANG